MLREATLELGDVRTIGPATERLRKPVAGYSSFGSVIRSKTLGLPSFSGGVHQSRCSS
jgi:hypothetical protein